eukprot:gene2192-2495_t
MFGDQLSWRFSNLAKFRWMDLIHPAKFDERKKASSQDQRSLIEKLLQLYPFAVSDATATEYNLNVLYNNNEIALLLQKLVQERDAVVARKNEKRARLLRAIQQRESNQESQDFEENDLFEPDENTNIEPEAVKQGKANVQDLLSVIKKDGLEDALPQALTLLKLAVVIPLTSVHCERVFRRMKRVVSRARSRMVQLRKENVVLLKVENRLLRWLAEQSFFKDNVVTRFQRYNPRCTFDKLLELHLDLASATEFYNENKEIPALKFQSFVAPNGLAALQYAPFEERRYDSGILRESDLLPLLQHHSISPDGNVMYIYGVPAYSQPQAPFENQILTPEQQLWNQKIELSESQCGVAIWRYY